MVDNTIKVWTESARLFVKCPKCNEFLADARRRGKWNATHGAWSFDPRDEDWVRERLYAIYGVESGVPVLCDVQVQVYKLEETRHRNGNGTYIQVFGRVIASKYQRDREPLLGDGCAVTEGAFERRGGSANNPRIAAPQNLIIEIRDVPLRVVEAETAAVWPGSPAFVFGVIVAVRAAVPAISVNLHATNDVPSTIVQAPPTPAGTTVAEAARQNFVRIRMLESSPDTTIYVNDEEVVLPFACMTGLVVKMLASRQGAGVRLTDKLMFGELEIRDDAKVEIAPNTKFTTIKTAKKTSAA